MRIVVVFVPFLSSITVAMVTFGEDTPSAAAVSGVLLLREEDAVEERDDEAALSRDDVDDDPDERVERDCGGGGDDDEYDDVDLINSHSDCFCKYLMRFRMDLFKCLISFLDVETILSVSLRLLLSSMTSESDHLMRLARDLLILSRQSLNFDSLDKLMNVSMRL